MTLSSILATNAIKVNPPHCRQEIVKIRDKDLQNAPSDADQLGQLLRRREDRRKKLHTLKTHRG
jgi:hypothetical protein